MSRQQPLQNVSENVGLVVDDVGKLHRTVGLGNAFGLLAVVSLTSPLPFCFIPKLSFFFCRK
jgi:hypothetical protein